MVHIIQVKKAREHTVGSMKRVGLPEAWLAFWLGKIKNDDLVCLIRLV